MAPHKKDDIVSTLLPNDATKKDKGNSPHKLSMSHLSSLVKEIVSQRSWWQLYGIDLAILVICFALLPVSYWLLGSDSVCLVVIGLLLFAYIHACFTVKFAHAALHNTLAGQSRFWNYALATFLIKIWGGFTVDGSHEAHIQIHHPYTNVIGLGDSSTWRVPFLDRITYLFIAPLFLPMFNTIIALTLLAGRWWSITRLLCITSMGYVMHYCLFHYVSGLSVSGTILCMITTRSVFAIPYIHVNIFQHIGLPMYDVTKRPKRLYQLASAALNLPSNLVLDYSFGHSIISCHIEHHLFPQLSDNMCLQIKPLVSRYLKNHGLPYNEETYLTQLKRFYRDYDQLMVKAPPITDLAGIQ